MFVSLDGAWRVTFPDGRAADVPVPGCYDIAAGRLDLAGPVAYHRTFFLDESPNYARLRFGAVSYACRVWLNGVLVGEHEGLWDSFALDVSDCVREGANELRVDVVKPGYEETDAYPLRQVLSGFIPDVLATFGGLWDHVTLETAEHFFVTRHAAMGDCAGKAEFLAEMEVKQGGLARTRLCVLDAKGVRRFFVEEEERLAPGTTALRKTIRLSQPRCWSVADPHLYRYEWRICLGDQEVVLTGHLGLREIRAEGPRILLNGAPVYWRGLLHWGYYDEEMIPNPSRETLEREFRKIREYGFNAIKHCLYIPREEALRMADEQGLLLWVELPLWLPEDAGRLTDRVRREYPRILAQLQGHPSVCIVSLGCELNDCVSAGLLEEMYHLAKERVQALVRDNSGSGECYGGLATDFADFFDYHFYADLENMEPLMESFTPGLAKHPSLAVRRVLRLRYHEGPGGNPPGERGGAAEMGGAGSPDQSDLGAQAGFFCRRT